MNTPRCRFCGKPVADVPAADRHDLSISPGWNYHDGSGDAALSNGDPDLNDSATSGLSPAVDGPILEAAASYMAASERWVAAVQVEWDADQRFDLAEVDDHCAVEALWAARREDERDPDRCFGYNPGGSMAEQGDCNAADREFRRARKQFDDCRRVLRNATTASKIAELARQLAFQKLLRTLNPQ